MNLKRFAILAVLLLSFNLYANEEVVEENAAYQDMQSVSESEKCDAQYSECMQLCEEVTDKQEQCFDACDSKYDNCIKAAE